MKKGIDLIREERQEQIHKHGWSINHDKGYVDGQLTQAAMFAFEQAGLKLGVLSKEIITFPKGWDLFYEKKIRDKTVLQQLIVCGAFHLAEYDRTSDSIHLDRANSVGMLIDNFIRYDKSFRD